LLEIPDQFWLGKIRKIGDPNPNDNALMPRYEVWFHVPIDSNADIWSYKTKYRPEKIRNNPQATAILTINHFLTVKFTLTRTQQMRAEALKLLKRVLQIDQQSSSPTSITPIDSPVSSPDPLTPPAPSTPIIPTDNDETEVDESLIFFYYLQLRLTNIYSSYYF